MVSKVYQISESDITWLSSTGTNVITLTSVAAGAGRQGELHDFNFATAKSREYVWRAWVKFTTTPVVGEVVDVYWKTSDGTNPDNDDGAGDAAVSAEDKLLNLTFLKSIVVDEASTTPPFVASGKIDIEHELGAPVFWNASADALSATALDHGFKLTPVPLETQ